MDLWSDPVSGPRLTHIRSAWVLLAAPGLSLQRSSGPSPARGKTSPAAPAHANLHLHIPDLAGCS